MNLKRVVLKCSIMFFAASSVVLNTYTTAVWNKGFPSELFDSVALYTTTAPSLCRPGSILMLAKIYTFDVTVKLKISDDVDKF